MIAQVAPGEMGLVRASSFVRTPQARAAGCWPNLFIVGVARAATTSLADYLGQHPDVFMAAVKEPYFFTHYHPDWVEVPQEESEYLSLFRPGGAARYRCEATPAYFWDEESARSIKRASPDARIVISLREPVGRAYSEFALLRRTVERRRSFLAAISEELRLTEAERGDDPRYNYVSRGLYSEGVARFLQTFGPDHVHVLFYKELVANPRAEMRRLYEFLDLDPAWAGRIDLRARNQGGVARNKLADKLLYSPLARSVGRRLVPPGARSSVERALMQPATGDSEVGRASRLLRQVYAEDQRRLERLLGRQVPWRLDQAGDPAKESKDSRSGAESRRLSTSERDEKARQWPNLFLVGVMRGGTTSLWTYLNQHPEIYMAAVKEPHFFSKANPRLAPTYKDERAYLALFAGAREPLRGEASASYFSDPAIPAAIKSVSPEAKILVSLREPVERAHSHYWHDVSLGAETRSFSDAVQEELTGVRGEGPGEYVRLSLYSEPLQRYLDVFGQNVHVVFLEEIARDPVATFREVFAFLSVDPAVADQLVIERRYTFQQPRGRLAGSIVHSPLLRTIGRRAVPVRFRSRLEEALFAQQEKPPLEPDVRRLLEDIFRPDGKAVEGILGRPLPWQSTIAD